MFRSGGMRSVSKQIAHTTILPLGNKDLRLLQDLISAEKNVVTTMQKLGDEFAKASEALKQWGLGEGEDLGDILSASREILTCVSSSLLQFAGHEAAIRVHMKAVRTREENLDAMRKQRKAVASKAEAAEKKLSKMSSEHKQLAMQTDLLNRLRDEIRQLDSDIMLEEARLSDYKRQTTKDWMALKFGGLLELAQKVVMVGNFGKELIEEIPLDTSHPGYGRAPYVAHDRTARIVGEALNAIGQVVFQPTTGNLAYHYEPGSQVAPPPHPPVQNAPSHLETPAQTIARQQGGYAGLGHGQPPQPEPHAVYPGLPQGSAPPRLEHPSFDRSFSSSMMSSVSTNADNASEFGMGGPPPSQSQTLGGMSSGPYPPRTSSIDQGGNRFATLPHHGYPQTPNMIVAAPPPTASGIYSPTPQPASNPQRTQLVDGGPTSPMVPPKDDHNPWTQPSHMEPPAAAVAERVEPRAAPIPLPAPPQAVETDAVPRSSNDQSRFSVDSMQDLDIGQNEEDREQGAVHQQQQSQASSRPVVRKSYSGISDGGADLVLAYYHNEDESHTPVAETTPIPNVRSAGGAGGYGGGDNRRDVSDEDPYAADAFENGAAPMNSSFSAPHQPSLNLPPTQPLRPRSSKGPEEIRAANVAAAREVGRELDALSFTSAIPPSTTMTGPPPRVPSNSAPRPQALASAPPYASPSSPQEAPDSTPPHLSLRFTDTSFDIPGMSSPTSPQAQLNDRLRSMAPGTSPDVPRPIRSRSPPPSFEAATSTPSTPNLNATRAIPTAVFDPNVIPRGAPTKAASPPPSSGASYNLSVTSEASVSRSSSTSAESTLSSLAPPHPPYAATSPSRGTTTLMPTTPTGSQNFGPPSQESLAISPKMISAGAFKKFRAGDSPTARSGTADAFPVRKQSIPPMDTYPSYTSAASGISSYTSAPTSPVRERSTSELRQASPLSIPMNARQPGRDSDAGGAHRESAISGGGYDGGEHSPVGVAVGSPTHTTNPEAWLPPSAKNRFTIGDAGWRSRPGRNDSLPPSDTAGGENHGSGGPGGYGTGNYTTSLE
ncbi:hypothetical protein FRB95_007910 [Tulasnella sp. JGI-2019a]|nr:hypothetical protein FRB95_007910 [Tulasnella sp. JGI-2019a]